MRITFVMILLTLGCFEPSVPSGGFKCGPGKACPTGQVCQSVFGEDRCYASRTCSGGKPGCTPILSDGDECDPACQCGCGKDKKCTVLFADYKAHCVDTNTKKLDDTCNADPDDCGAGLICLVYRGCARRCVQMCRENSHCDGGAKCSFLFTLSVALCEARPNGCNPVGAAASMCAISEQSCWVLSDTESTGCSCEGNRSDGAPCNSSTDVCAPGLLCIYPDSGTTGKCQLVCGLGKSGDCPSGVMCRPYFGSTKWGYCDKP